MFVLDFDGMLTLHSSICVGLFLGFSSYPSTVEAGGLTLERLLSGQYGSVSTCVPGDRKLGNPPFPSPPYIQTWPWCSSVSVWRQDAQLQEKSCPFFSNLLSHVHKCIKNLMVNNSMGSYFKKLTKSN